MFYRVVMQGRALGNADLDEVKRQFVRVTGLPLGVAENLFGGMPQVVKRQVPQSDAERIAATLRAIGAAATVERELTGTEDETAEGIRVGAALYTGPPTVIPGSEPLPTATPALSRHARLLRAVLAKWPLFAGATMLVVGAIVVAPFVDDLVTNIRRAPAPTPGVAPARTPAAEVVSSSPPMNATSLYGPWRCTDQQTGVSTYWTYTADSALVFHGDALRDGPAPGAAAASAPVAWQFDGQHLLHTFAQRAPDNYTVAELTLTRLRYGNERGLDIQCRRP